MALHYDKHPEMFCIRAFHKRRWGITIGSIWTKQEDPKNWCEFTIVQVCMKGDRLSCENHHHYHCSAVNSRTSPTACLPVRRCYRANKYGMGTEPSNTDKKRKKYRNKRHMEQSLTVQTHVFNYSHPMENDKFSTAYNPYHILQRLQPASWGPFRTPTTKKLENYIHCALSHPTLLSHLLTFTWLLPPHGRKIKQGMLV